MALRPFITAGVAFATAGVVAATVAIAPPMSPGDVKVARETQVALNALITDPNLVPLINEYFSQPPDGIRTGATGVVQQLLLNANENDPVGQALINVYFNGGATSLVQTFLTAFNSDANSREQINTYFDGGLSELARLRLLWATNDPTQRAWINRYFGEFVNDDGSDNIAQNGTQGVIWRFLADRGLSVDQRRILDTFWNAPTAFNSQAVPVFLQAVDEDDEPIFDEDGNPVYVQAVDENNVPIVDENGDPVYVIEGYLGNSNPARRGSFGVLYNQIKGTGLSPDQQVTLDEFWDGGVDLIIRNRLINSTADPDQRATIAQYFDGGIDEVIKQRLLSSGDANADHLTNEFFDNGITGVIRYLLVGPVPVPPEEEEEEAADETADALRVATVEDATVDESAADVTAVAKTTAPVEAAPVAVAAPAPVEAAAPAPEATPTEEAPEDETAAAIKTGNKVEPVIILPGGASTSGARGGGAWGWKGVADRVNGFVKGVQNATGGAPAADSGDADAGDAGGESDGGE